MPWFKVDDGWWSHPKTLQLSDSAQALWIRAGTWSMAHLTDGHVPAAALSVLRGRKKTADELIACGMWDADQTGYRFHDWDEYQPSKESVIADRAAGSARQAVARNPELRSAVRDRDNDQCRYCGSFVAWNDRRGSLGGTYDHVIPAGGSTLENLVVCCRGCNSRKGRRTPSQAGMKLRPIPEPKSELDPIYESDLDTPSSPTRPDPTRPLTKTKKASSAGTTGPFCSRHPNGTEEACGACRTARIAFEDARNAEKNKPTPTPRAAKPDDGHRHKYDGDYCIHCQTRRP